MVTRSAKDLTVGTRVVFQTLTTPVGDRQVTVVGTRRSGPMVKVTFDDGRALYVGESALFTLALAGDAE